MSPKPGPSPNPSSLDLTTLTADQLGAFTAALPALTASAPHRQAAAESIIEALYTALRAAEGPACVLARCFQTCAYARLPLQYRDAADILLDLIPSHPNMRCLTLLATRGTKIVWNGM